MLIFFISNGDSTILGSLNNKLSCLPYLLKIDPASDNRKFIGKKMYNLKESGPMIPPSISNPNLKKYYCPHCSRFLFTGNVQRLRMVCHHCQTMINTDEPELTRIH